MPTSDTTHHPLAYRIADGAREIGVSRSRIYELVARGEIQAKKLGGATIVERSELLRYLDSLPDADIGGSVDRTGLAS